MPDSSIAPVPPTDSAEEPAAGPPDGWRPASPKLVPARRLTAVATSIVPVLAGAALGLSVSPWWWLLALPFLLGSVNVLWRSPVYVASLSHIEREDDLLVREGVWTRTTTLVPYGRLQYVELSEGPINSRYGLAKLEVHTASSTGVTIPGLPLADAQLLRARLAARVQTRDSGL